MNIPPFIGGGPYTYRTGPRKGQPVSEEDREPAQVITGLIWIGGLGGVGLVVWFLYWLFFS